MMSAIWLRDLLLALHLLSAAIWVGGMLYAILVLRVGLAVLDAGPRLQVQMVTLKKFFFYVWHVMPIMILTGWAMVAVVYGGFAMLPWSINVMQGLGILMALVFLYTFFDPWKRLSRAIRPAPDLVPRIRSLMITNLALGLITIAVGAFGHVW
jgi:uncharacterized membrane protein